MNMTTGSTPSVSKLPSVFDALPDDLGGIHARQGFAYQDHVAAGFYIEMLTKDNLIEVACETYDDVRLVWQEQQTPTVEFVQVKAEHPDQLWTIAKLCERAKSTTKPNGEGSSILEKSLSRDKFAELSWFRIVTCRQVHSDIQFLVTHERGHVHRSLENPVFKTLTDSVAKHLNGVKSPKQNDTTFWLRNATWSVIPDNDIRTLNQPPLSKALYALGERCDPDSVNGIYENLLALAKTTAEYGPEKWKQKSITRDQLQEKIREWANPYPTLGKPEKLNQKLADAGLDETCRNVAREQQRHYMQKRRQANYLNTQESDDIDLQVLDKLHTLRSALDSGRINETGVEFHDRCLSEVRTIASAATNPATSTLPSYLSGCMYEITARCSHRFRRFQP